MQVDDDDGFGGPRGPFPLYIAVSLGGAFAATLGVIGFVTFQHVESSSASVAASHAQSRAVLHAESGIAPPRSVRGVAAATGTPRVVVRRRPHPARGPKVEASRLKASAFPSAPPVAAVTVAAALDPASESRPPVAGVSRHRAVGGRATSVTDSASADGAAPSGAKPDRDAGPPVILTATSVATSAPALPATAVTVTAPSAAPTEAPAPEATPAVVAAAPAPVHPVQRVVEARVKLAAEPDFPSDPSVAGLHGTSAVLVTIGPRGTVVNVALERSSGHASFDQAALNAARRTVYAAAVIDGKPATASYRMVYEFGQ